MNGLAVKHFLRAVRRRLWIEALLRRLRIAMWVSSLLLLLSAVLFVGIGGPGFSTAIITALLAGVLVLSPALFSLPSLDECAQRADRHFEGYSLLTAAQELNDVEDLRPAEETVQARAAVKASEWAPELHTLAKHPDAVGLLVSVIPLLIAFLVFETFSERTHAIQSPGLQTHVAAGGESATDIFTDTSVLPELRQAIARAPAEEDEPSRPGTDASGTLSPIKGVPETAAAEVLEAEFGDEVAAGFADPEGPGGREAGSARRSAGDGPTLDADLDLQLPTEDVEISRYGSMRAGRRETGQDFIFGAGNPRPAHAVVSPVPAPPSPSAWTTLTAAEVAYARRFLEASRHSDE